MLRSMTGFGVGEGENGAVKVHLEIKAVNQRFLEFFFRMPRRLNPWEEFLRREIRQKLSRGKVDVFVTFEDKREDAVEVKVNFPLAWAYAEALANLRQEFYSDKEPYGLETFAALPDILTAQDKAAPAETQEALAEALQNALTGLMTMREKEGENIRQDFLGRLAKLETYGEELAQAAPDIVKNYRQRLEKTLAEATPNADFDEARLIQEVALYADRINFTEELVRLKSHIRQFRETMESLEPVGRKLDFLLQEMNREVNTAGSKGSDAGVASLVVEMKAELEKLREQVQNIE